MGLYHGEKVTWIVGGGAAGASRHDGQRRPACRRSASRRSLGRTFTAEDDRPAPPATVILSYRLLADASSAATRASSAEASCSTTTPYTVIGVMPRGFHFPRSDALLLEDAALRRRRLPGLGAHQQLARGGRPSPARRDARAGARRDGERSPRSRSSSSPRRTRTRAPTSVTLDDEVSQRSRLLLVALLRRGRLRAADRLRQPGEPAARAGARAAARAGGARGYRRRARAPGATAADREPAARGRRRRAGDRPRGRSRAAARAARADDAADRGDAVGRRAGTRLCGRADGAHRHRPSASRRCVRAGARPGSRRPARGRAIGRRPARNVCDRRWSSPRSSRRSCSWCPPVC